MLKRRGGGGEPQKGGFGSGVRRVAAALARGSGWDTQQGAVRLPVPPPRVPPRCWRRHAVYFYRAARRAARGVCRFEILDLNLFPSFLLLLALPLPAICLGEILARLRRGVAGGLTFSRCLCSQPGWRRWKSQASVGISPPWLLACRAVPVPRSRGSLRAPGLPERAAPRGNPVLSLCVECRECLIGTFETLM